MDPMLRKALRKHNGLRQQIDNLLLGDEGDMWEAVFRNCVAKRPCWTNDEKSHIKAVGVLSATIDLDVNPSLPFSGATIEEHKKGGQVTIEKRSDVLYIDGHKVVLHLSERQVNGKTIQGHELRRELDGKQVLNAGVLDFLMANQSFVPDEMKKDAKGNTIYTFFWGTIYRNSDGYLYVRVCYWDDGRLEQRCSWLGSGWDFKYPAGCLAK